MGLLGAGGIARAHVAQVSAVPELARIAGVADIDGERAESVAASCEATAYTHQQELFDNADVIFVCTPNHLHREHTIAAAEAGKQVYCEKPLSLSVADSQEMVQACRQAGVKLATGFVVRFRFPGSEILRMLREGELGDPVGIWCRRLHWIPPEKFTSWRRDPDTSGGVLCEVLAHEVDWLREAGGPVRRVFGRKALRWSRPSFLANDHVWAVLEYESGLTGTLEGSYCAQFEAYSKGVLGTDASAETRPGQKGFDLFLKRSAEKEETQIEPVKTSSPAAEFLAAVVQDREPPASGEDGLAVTAISDAILRSAENGEPVEIPEQLR